MIKSKLVLALALSVGLVGSAAAALTDMTVNGEKVPASRLEAVYNNAVKAGAKAGPELEARVKRDVTEEVVLLQEAAKAKIDRTKEYRDAIDRVGKQLKVELLVADYAKKNPVSDKEVRAAYDNAKKVYGDTEYQVRHILVKTEQEAKNIIQRLNKGEKFDALAKSESLDPKSGPAGGLIGWLSPSNVEPNFGNAFKILSAGDVAQAPIQNQFGWHVVKLDAKRSQKNFPTYESQKDSLRAQLSQLNAKRHFAELVQKAKVR
ncbi:peptidylprolyl isomerase [Sutterella wadsworthensis]|uniref:peptidylprolyl isomerase n=1 Tax=Sutterella wadsworthensis TaxID=40545 RepID=UPI002657BE0D|nr:peptidylprolyl isomerase [Sutterella wadsworthensis]